MIVQVAVKVLELRSLPMPMYGTMESQICNLQNMSHFHMNANIALTKRPSLIRFIIPAENRHWPITGTGSFSTNC